MYLHFTAPFLKFSLEGAWMDRCLKLQTCRAKIRAEKENRDFDCISIVYSNFIMAGHSKAPRSHPHLPQSPSTEAQTTECPLAFWKPLAAVTAVAATALNNELATVDKWKKEVALFSHCAK